jgi:hypothetical protein
MIGHHLLDRVEVIMAVIEGAFELRHVLDIPVQIELIRQPWIPRVGEVLKVSTGFPFLELSFTDGMTAVVVVEIIADRLHSAIVSVRVRDSAIRQFIENTNGIVHCYLSCLFGHVVLRHGTSWIVTSVTIDCYLIAGINEAN